MAANRCDGCGGKFGSLGDPSVEIESEDSSGNPVSVDVRLDVECGGCGSEFMQGYTTVEAEIDEDSHNESCRVTDEDGTVVTFNSDEDRFLRLIGPEREFTITNGSVEVEFIEQKRRRFYSIKALLDIKCSTCEVEWQETAEAEISTSELESV